MTAAHPPVLSTAQSAVGRLRPWVGGSLVAIGILHLASTPMLYGAAWGSIVDGGVLGALDADPSAADLRSSGFWFVVTGLASVLLGLVVGWGELHWGAVPPFLGPGLLVLMIFGVVIAPVSGFWIFLVPAVLALRRRPVAARLITSPMP